MIDLNYHNDDNDDDDDDDEGDKADDWVIGLHPLDSQSSLAASPLHCQCHHHHHHYSL